ncbi:MAG: DUF3570 domain-containing protein [Methyloglobulus sp.]|nr:DUF3570 domain-containing protein [Methyloglobulus sp.]
MAHSKITEQISRPQASLSALTAAALVLPGLLMPTAHAAEDDSVDFQYSHYQEGKRDIYSAPQNLNTFAFEVAKIPQNLNPIEVDSVHGSARVTLTDRVKFAFNYLQDTWSGATPIGTAAAIGNGNRGFVNAVSGPSPLAAYDAGFGYMFFDKDKHFYHAVYDPNLGDFKPGLRDDRLTHVLSYASPETRKQGDFKLSYQWDEAALDIGGGISVENDYESRFGNVGGHFDFNQKQTTLNWGASYTNSDTNATLDPDGLPFFDTTAYATNSCDPYNGSQPLVNPAPLPGTLENTCTFNPTAGAGQAKYDSSGAIIRGNRQDWGAQLGLSQVLSKNTLVSLDLAYTRSTGYLSNPYKVVYAYYGPFNGDGKPFFAQNGNIGSAAWLEIRPDERNLFNWHLGYNHYLEPLDAALHFNYHFAHDDWGINAHTFEADWVQPLGAGWSVTPRIRYYSQSAADFYTTGIFPIYNGIDFENLPKHYSSDQRLSGFGTLSGGVTVEKKFTKGVSLETGFEYYTHQGNLKLGGGGEQAFADYDYWVANAALKVNLGALNAGGGSHDGHGGHHHHSNSPAGVMFDHTLPKAGDFMAGYRFMRSEQAGDMLLGSHPVGLDAGNANGCEGRECAVTPNFMAMSMHMLDLMYAPTDWLTLMLMPQWMDMEMTMTANENVQITGGHGGHAGHGHQTGGIGDFGAYALFRAFDHPNHHLTVSLGGTAPTGDVDIVLRKTGAEPVYNRPIHYGMQLGSGTWDFKPALTYTGEMDNFLWGAQANATIRLEDSNESGFAFGDIFQGSVWGGYNWTNWLATTVRGVYTSQGKVQGAYPTIFVPTYDPNTGLYVPGPYTPQHIGSFDFPGNYGGQFVDLGLGVNVTVPSGAFQGNTLKFEWLQPVHTDYNGYQLDRDYALNFTWSYGF